MAHPIDELTTRWRSNPDAPTTLALCDALRAAPRGPLVDEVGKVASARHAEDANVLTAAARMYIAAQRLGDAQTILVTAGKAAPRDPAVYRWLGEVLLRRGDAERAIKVFERALQFGGGDSETRLWAERAKVFKPMQAASGMRAVASEVARTAPVSGARAPVDSMTDSSTTEVRVIPAPALGRADDDDDDRMTNPARPLPRSMPPAAGMPPRVDYAVSTGSNVLSVDMRGRDDDEPSVTARFEPNARAERAAREDVFRALPQTPLASAGREGFAEVPRRAAGVGNGGVAANLVARSAPAEGANLVEGRRLIPAGISRPNANLGAPDEKLGGAPVALDPRDLLDALALAGVYEPQAQPAGPPMRWDAAEKKRRGPGTITLIVTTVLFLAAAAGTIFYVKDRRAKEHAQAEALLDQVAKSLDEGIPSELAGAEAKLGRAFELDSRSPRAALVWLHERALLGLLKGGSEIAFEDSIARGKEVGVAEADMAFARVASFLFQGDTVGAAALLPKWDGPAAKDAWYQLLAGATLERAGDAHAFERYEAAAKLEPGMAVAAFARVRVTAFEREPQKAAEMAKQLGELFPGRAEPPTLAALAWGRDPARSEAAPPEVDEMTRRAGELPASLAAVPHALAAVRAMDKHALGDAKTQLQEGLAVADSPAMASWLGAIALGTGDEQLARKAALAAVSFSAVYAPARVLAARVALLGDRLDESLKATEELEPGSPDVAVVRAAAAYERVDADALGRAIEAVAPEARKLPFLAGLESAADVLAGRVQVPAVLAAATDEDVPWSDLVAMDAALDAGDVETAEKLAASWRGTEDRPLRALRLARLARYGGKLDAADELIQRALGGGTVTPRVLEERVLVLVARGKGSEAGPLLAKYPLVLGPTATWLSALVAASAGKIEDARGRTASLDVPPGLAPVPTRVVAAVALGAMHDRKRGVEVVKGLLSQGVANPDVAAAALALGFRRVERGRRVTYSAP